MNTLLPVHKIFPVKSKYIEESERQLGVEFPVIYKNKMLKKNGGQIKTGKYTWYLLPFFDKSDIHRMIDTCDHIGITTVYARKWYHFPREAVAIGTNTAGDLLILLTEKHHPHRLAESVYTWNWQTGEVAILASDIHLTDVKD